MTTVGIKELKSKLSAYLNEVRGGKSVLVTDHAEEVALVIPLSMEYRLVRSLEISGRASWSKGKPSGTEKGVTIQGEPLSTTILKERE
jgi:prevent-host-death family protein